MSDSIDIMAKVPKKRVGNDVDPNEAKRFRVDNVALKLSDLNEDVLLKIFSYLNEEEMINIVKARGLFLATCQQAFKLKYRNKFIEISLHLDYRHYIDLLRYFGKNITKLQLQYSWANKEKRSRIHDLVLATCHDTLIEIHFIGISTESKIDKCFTKLKTLHIAHGSVDNSVCQFGKWFPLMEDLQITSITNIDTKLNVRRRIPSLKRFSMVFSKNCTDQHMLRVCKLNNFMNSNPQLSEICLKLSDTHNHAAVVGRINMVDDAAANVKQLSNLKLELVYSRGLYSEELAQLMVPKGSIEHLELTINRLNEQTCEFVKSFSNLKSLTLVIDFLRICFMADQFFSGTAWLASTKHVQLTELNICFYAEVRFLAIDTLNVALLAVESFMKHCKNLNTVTIKYKLGQRSASVGEFNKGVSFDALKNRINLGVWSFTTFEPFDFDNGIFLKFKRL